MKSSAGLLMYRQRDGELQVLLTHPGGPFWRRKDVWFLPKGEVEPGEDELAAAIREFTEETGFTPVPPYLPLGSVRNRSGKQITAWAFASDCDPALLRSVTFTTEWPPRSGRHVEFPEVDRAGWFSVEEAHARMSPAEYPLVERLASLLRSVP